MGEKAVALCVELTKYQHGIERRWRGQRLCLHLESPPKLHSLRSWGCMGPLTPNGALVEVESLAAQGD